MAGRARHDVGFWADHISRHQSSGLTLIEYCRRERINIHQFYYWRKRAMSAVTSTQVAAPAPSSGVSRELTGVQSASATPLENRHTVVVQVNDRTSIHVPVHMLETLEAVLKMVQRLNDQVASVDIGAFRSVVVRS